MSETTHRPPAEPSGEQLISLARAEYTLAQAGRPDRAPAEAGGALLGPAGIVLLWTGPVLAAAAVLVLSRVMPVWLAVLCAVAGSVLLGVALALAGRFRLRRREAPRRAVNGQRADAAGLSKPAAEWPGSERSTRP
ncbi:phage holin family protein [Catellatospora bangladeshensis]|uniref:Phage holin family protein n=1 Tax=Catellatospora bangladeshensis TaxID=310355 RepID=A0A8J3JHN5_9ACTN|nr:phage holin family protein [Catellatospora bangladeshensis]GIF80662.1 hypothetical protein Cba03nite_20110 [Catellatospora bangladeshensis]